MFWCVKGALKLHEPEVPLKPKPVNHCYPKPRFCTPHSSVVYV